MSKNQNNSNNFCNSSNNDWIECTKWLDKLNCLPFSLKQKLYNNQLQLNEFASSLRDGEMLCNLLNQIIPGCIDSSLINKRSQMSQLLCLNNIRLFLFVCKSQQYFNLTESDLFDEHMLYDLVDLASVIRTLSIISKSELTLKKTNIQGFNLANDNNNNLSPNSSINGSSSRRLSFSNNNTNNNNNSFENNNINNNDDIYYNIVPAEVETPESYYTDESFLFNGLIDQQAINDNNVYQTIVSSNNHNNQQHHHVHQPLKRDFVMREILSTEENFLDGLNTLMNDFLIPLSKVLNQQDRSIIFTNIDKLIDLHKKLYSELVKACKGGQGRTIRICKVFESLKVDLMKEYAEYFSSIDRSLAKCDSLTQVSLNSINDQLKQQYLIEFRTKLDECRKTSKRGNFKLTDLLRLPYQRVLKYHLLFNELLKQTDVDHSAKEYIKNTKESMCELGNYLNECQRDKENLNKIEQLIKHLIINNNSNESNRSSTSSSVYSSSINLNLLKDYGHYIKDDKFRIKSIDLGERYARTRSFFLFEKALIVCKLKGNYYNYKETLLINEYSIEDAENKQSPQQTLTSQSSSNLVSHSIISNLFGDLTSNSNLSTSSINLNSSNTPPHSLHLINTLNNKIHLIIFKNKEQKKLWKESLLKAKEKMKPDGQKSSNHFFELFNFDRDLQKCFTCQKYLLGLFYQGYKCNLCNLIAHKDCLIKINSICSSINSPAPTPTQTPPTLSLNQNNLTSNKSLSIQNPVITLTRSLSTSSSRSHLSQNSFQSFCAKAIYRYDGRPPPPESPVLIFNQGDLIQVIDDDDDDWWRGFILNKSKREEGYFPRRYVKVIQQQPQPQQHQTSTNQLVPISQIKLDDYPWFSPVDRFSADLILNRIPTDLNETLFMVRCRTEGGYAISIKHKGLVDHIKININDINSPLSSPLIIYNDTSDLNEQTHVYSIDQQHNFNSIVSLVNYYSQNLLKDNFPQLDTTLGIPYKKALPISISTAIALHDYDPYRNPNNTGEQIELKKTKKYFVLNKETNGWWRVYNNDGLIGYVPGSYLHEQKDQPES